MDKKEYGQRKQGVSRHGGKGTGRGKPFSDARKGGEGRSYSSGDKFGKTSRSDGGKAFEGSDRGSEGGFGERRSYGDRKSFGEKRSTGEGRSYGDRKSFGEKRSYGEGRSYGEKKSFGEKPSYGEGRSYGEKKSFGEKRSYGEGRSYGDKKSFGEKRSYGEGRSYGEKKSFGEKPSYGEGRSYGEKKSFGEKRSYGEGRSYGDKKSFGEKRSYGEGRSYGDKKSFGEKREYGQSEGFREKRGFDKERPSTGKSFDQRLKKPQRVPVKFEHPAKSEHPAKVEAPVTAKIGEERDGLVEASEETEDRIEGRNPVLEAFKSGRPINKLYIEKDSEEAVLLKIAAMAREKAVPVQYVDRRKLDLMSKTRIHQGVILEVAAHEYAEVEDMLALAEEKGEKPFLLVLDGITDTNNFGSVIRTAECAGVHGIIIPKRRSVSLNATVAKVAAGAQEYVPIARVTNLVQTLTELKEKGLWIIGSDMEGDKNYYDADLKGPIALVIGNEGEGMSRIVSEACDFNVRIPLKGTISSLNAGVAAGLILFEIAKQRG